MRGFSSSAASALALLLAGRLAAQCPSGQPPPCGRPVPGHALPSLAVLYLETRSHDSADIELAAGVTEELIRSLGGLPQLDVRSRYVSRRLAGADPLEGARAMNLAYVVTGSLDATRERLQVHAELVQPASGRLVWSQSYDRPRAQLAGLMGEMSDVIASRVAGVVVPRRAAAQQGRRAPDPLAYELYVRGRALFNQYDSAANHTSRDLLQQAVDRDSTIGAAWGVLGMAWLLSSDFGTPLREAAAHARSASLHALALDSLDGLGLSTLMGARYYQLDISAGAESLAIRGARLAPRDPIVLANACVAQVYRGDFEAGLAACRASVALDSASPLLRLNYALRLVDSRHFDEGIVVAAQADSLDPEGRPGRSVVARARRQTGPCDDFAGPAASTADSVRFMLAMLCKRRGVEIRPMFEQYIRGSGRHASLAIWFGVDPDSGLAVMERAVNGGPALDPEILLDASLDPFRRDPRFLALMRRMGFEDGRPR